MKYYVYKLLPQDICKELKKSCVDMIQEKYNISIYGGLRGKEIFFLAGIYDDNIQEYDWLNSIILYNRTKEATDELRIATNLN
jgi:hypothetical protein